MADLEIVREIQRLRGLTTDQLREEWFRLYGHSTNSRNRQFLFRKLAFRCQELRLGGLSERARRRIEELAPDHYVRSSIPALAIDSAVPRLESPMPRRRDPRDPIPGSVISKGYKGRDLRVVVREGGFEHDGTMYDSLTALAREITGSKNINGRLFFGLTRRKR